MILFLHTSFSLMEFNSQSQSFFALHTGAEHPLILRLFLNIVSTVQPVTIYKKPKYCSLYSTTTAFKMFLILWPFFSPARILSSVSFSQRSCSGPSQLCYQQLSITQLCWSATGQSKEDFPLFWPYQLNY